jgi:methyl-accepting chemotaxis protein
MAIPNWMAFLPLLLSLLSFSIFVKDVRRGPRGSLTRLGRWFLVLGFVGFGGSVFVVVEDIQEDRNHQQREKELIARLSSLDAANQSLVATQNRLSQEKGELLKLASGMNYKLVNQESLTNRLRDEVAVASEQAEDMRDLAERTRREAEHHASDLRRLAAEQLDATRKSRQESEDYASELRRLAEEQLDSANKTRRIAEEGRRHEDERRRREEECTWAKRFMPVDIQRRVYGCS